MMKTGLALVTKIEPILKEVIQIKEQQEHGKQELIESNKKFYAIYREVFKTESDAEHFINFCNLVYSMHKGQLPPIHILIGLFKCMYPIIVPKEIKGEQGHGKPELRKVDDTFTVILRESFTEKIDAENHLQEATTIKSMKL